MLKGRRATLEAGIVRETRSHATSYEDDNAGGRIYYSIRGGKCINNITCIEDL